MTDEEILTLYFSRNEAAISATSEKYSGRLTNLARRLVSEQDAEECVNDTYLSAWNNIPPTRPVYFFAWLGKVCRNFALRRLEWDSAVKRSAVLTELDAELEQCIPDTSRETADDSKAIGAAISSFLRTLSREKRTIFIRRYWYEDSVSEIAALTGCSQSRIRTMLHRLRLRLKSHLESEGISL